MATGNARWEVKPKGFATVQRTIDGKKWWVRPGTVPASGPNAPIPGTTGGGAPSGGRVATTTRTQARNRLVPREWVGSEGLIGSWAKAPRLDPTAWETMQNPENDRWFARPRTELTGMSPDQVATVRAYDRDTAAQGSRIDQSFAQWVQEAGQNAQQGSAALTGLAGVIGTGYTGDPTGAVLSEAARASTGAGVAPIVANLQRLPALARDAGLTARQAWDSDRGAGRRDLIQGINQGRAEAAEAEADRAAELRGQELEHLGKLAGLQTDLDVAGIRADTAAADREARVSMNDADNATSRANAEARLRAQEAKDAKAKGRKPPTANDIRQWAKRARAMWDGVPRTVTGDDGKSRTEYIQYDSGEILRELIAMGATRARAVKIVRQITGDMTAFSGKQYVPPNWLRF